MDRCSVAFAAPKAQQTAPTDANEVSLLRRFSDVALPVCAAAVRGAARAAASVSTPTDWCSVHAAPKKKADIRQGAADALRRPGQQPPPVNQAAPKAAAAARRPAANSEAADLPAESQTSAVGLRILLSRAIGLPKADMFGTADPYVDLRVVRGDPLAEGKIGIKTEELQKPKSKALQSRTVFKAKTHVIRGDLSPKWEETFATEIPLDESVGDMFIYLRVYDYDLVGSDDFLGHLSVGVLDAIVSSTQLSSGWRSLLRSCPKVVDRLDVLQDESLQVVPPFSNKILPVRGQESTYDLSAAEIFISVALAVPAHPGRSTATSVGFRRPVAPSVAGDVRQTNAELSKTNAEISTASQNGDVAIVRRSLKSGGEVNARAVGGTFDGCTPLHVACLKGFADMAMALVDVFGASLVARAPGGRTPAMLACEAPNETLAEWLIVEGVPADLKDDLGRTVLFYAAQAALPQFVSWLIGKQHLSANEQATDKSTPLVVACGTRAASAVVVAQQLLEAHASANSADSNGRTPLIVACEVGDDKCARLLLSTGKAEIDLVDAGGRAPVDFARDAAMPEATLRRLALPDRDPAEANNAEKQRPGETAEDAAKRQHRARKAAAPQDTHDWTAWRTMHPRRLPGAPRDVWEGSAPNDDTDAPLGTGNARSPAAGKKTATWEQYMADDDANDPLSLRSILARNGLSSGPPQSGTLFRLDGSIEGSLGEIPNFIGKVHSSPQQSPQTGRITRMRTWAASLRDRSNGRSKSVPPQANVKSTHEWDEDPPADDLSPRAFDDSFL